ncbi:hypothetical protein [Magnetospirillum molischianum]|uniref:Uncharacterized protein n=1 Tax=Magnetospirillum molischianum DSM 120 TaxID=1150626 RepID=H8FX52_MAGML|nr:hypothetical protein [Magnetospirillum molischianum]CCG42940.1 conserved hypothetical protein [Magnetospirillum molischianum DSM 120]
MDVAILPPPIEIDTETKKSVIGGLKKVLVTFQKSGHFDPAVTYQALIADPALLRSFIEAYLAHREEVDDIVRTADAAYPVRDEQVELICGVTLAQVQQLLVRTCARKVFDSLKIVETVTETVTRKSMFGLIKKTEQIERLSVDPAEERKARELLRYIAFAWQLPLIEAYLANLSYPHLFEIGEDILCLPTVEKIEAIAKFEPAQIKKVKAATGADFGAILADRPQAIAGIAVWNREMYEFYRNLLGDQSWTFFSRENAFFNVCASLDKSVLKLFGDMLCYIATENLVEIQRLNIDKVEVVVYALKSALGPRLPEILSVPAFAKDILRKVVDNLIHTNQEKDKLMTAFAISFKAMAPNIEEWLVAIRAG